MEYKKRHIFARQTKKNYKIMAQLTAFKMPFEELRGKLATKQQGITYSGQETGTNASTLTTGKHAATNFSKYIVAYKRRGINRFMVKSNTTMHQTIQAVRTKASLAFAIMYADYVLAQAVEGSDLRNNLEALKRAYDVRYPNTQTLREWIIGQFVPQVLLSSLLGYSLPDYRQAGVLRRQTVVTQGFGSATATIDSTILGSTTAVSVVNYLNAKYDVLANSGAWNTIRTYMAQSIAVHQRFLPVTIEGVKTLCVIPTSNTGQLVSGLPTEAIDIVLDDTQENQVTVILFKASTLKPIGGGKRFALYKDAEMTTPLKTTDSGITELWAKEVELS